MTLRDEIYVELDRHGISAEGEVAEAIEVILPQLEQQLSDCAAATVAELTSQLNLDRMKYFVDHPGEPWPWNTEQLKLLVGVWGQGFESAHKLRECGHSVGDYRAPNYPKDQENYSCVGCDSVAAMVEQCAEWLLSGGYRYESLAKALRALSPGSAQWLERKELEARLKQAKLWHVLLGDEPRTLTWREQDIADLDRQLDAMGKEPK